MKWTRRNLYGFCFGFFTALFVAAGLFWLYFRGDDRRPLAQSPANAQSSATPSKPEAAVKQIQIPANVMWFDTGIDTTGRVVTIEYVSGTWTNGGDKPIYTDWMGSGSWSGLILKGAPFRSLVGKTDAGTFFVGSQYDVKNGKGHLFLSINDVPDKFADNQGSLLVIIRVK